MCKTVAFPWRWAKIAIRRLVAIVAFDEFRWLRCVAVSRLPNRMGQLLPQTQPLRRLRIANDEPDRNVQARPVGRRGCESRCPQRDLDCVVSTLAAIGVKRRSSESPVPQTRPSDMCLSRGASVKYHFCEPAQDATQAPNERTLPYVFPGGFYLA